jgi:hypothetical protein
MPGRVARTTKKFKLGDLFKENLKLRGDKKLVETGCVVRRPVDVCTV